MDCENKSMSRLSEKCRSCENIEICRNKRMESMAYLFPSSEPLINHSQNIEIRNEFVNQKDIIDSLNKNFEIKLNCRFNN